MYKLTIPKDIAPCTNDVQVFITKGKIEKDLWYMLYNYLDYNVYIIWDLKKNKRLVPDYFFGVTYIRKFIEELQGINKPYPKQWLEYFKQNNIEIPENFEVVNIKV